MSRTTLVRLSKRFLISMEALVNVYSGFQVKYLPCQTVLQVPLLGLGTTGKAIEMKSGKSLECCWTMQCSALLVWADGSSCLLCPWKIMFLT